MRERRTMIVGAAAATSLALLGDQMLYAVLPSRPEAAGITVAALGVVLSVHRFIRLGANPVGGVLYDRFGRRQPFLLGMTFAVVATTGYLVSSGFWPLLVARLFWGLAFALISVGNLAILMDITQPADRGRTVGLFQSLVGLGTFLGLLLSGILTDLVGYRGTLAIYAPLTALGWLVAFVALSETAPAARPLAGVLRGVGGGAPVAEGSGPSILATLGRLDRRLLAPGFVSFVNFFASHGVLMATLGVYLKQHAAAEGGFLVPVASLTGILLASRRLITMLSSPLAGYLADRTGRRRLVAGIGAASAAAGFLTLVAGSGTSGILIGVALTSIGEGVMHPPVAAWVGDAAPPSVRGVVMGGFATLNDLGGATGPLLGYALAATVGLGWAYGVCGVLTLSALGVLVAVRTPPAG